MEIKLDKPLIVLDIEATGDQINKDRIVEIGMIKTNPDGSEEVYEQRINPQIPIPLNISEIHSIYDLDVKDSPTFKELANDIKTFIGDSDLCGFNSNKFDIPILEEEFLRAGLKSNFESKKLVDVQNIFHKMEKRTLGAAHVFYCGKEMENAHSAIHDARATLDVLKSQTKKYSELENNIDFLSDFSKANKAQTGYYEFPTNMEKNPMNENVTDFTFGEVLDHVDSIVDNNDEFNGIFPGSSNLRVPLVHASLKHALLASSKAKTLESTSWCNPSKIVTL